MEFYDNKIALQYLLDGLKQCEPISEKMLIRLLEKVGVNSN